MSSARPLPTQCPALLLDQIPQSVFAHLIITVANTLLKWDLRVRTRRTLTRLTDAELNDIGLTRDDADTEARRPFWQG